MSGLCACLAVGALMLGAAKWAVASPVFTISFGGVEFTSDGFPFGLGTNGALFLNDGTFTTNIGPHNEVAIEPTGADGSNVVFTTIFPATISGDGVKDVRGVRLSNIMIKAQVALTNFVISAKETETFGALDAAGVRLGANTILYPVGGQHHTSITLDGFVDGAAVGTVSQKDDTAGAGGFPLLDPNVTDGKVINLAAGKHTIESRLTVTMEKDAILTLQGSSEAGVEAVPEPGSVVLLGPVLIGLIGWGQWQREHRLSA